MAQVTITSSDVAKIARLANLQVSKKEEELFAKQFSQTLEVINHLNEINTDGYKLTSQVNNLQNVTRPDEIDKKRQLTQEEALSGSKNTHKGFFVVKQILDK